MVSMENDGKVTARRLFSVEFRPITIGRGGVADRAHTPDEWWANISGTRGIKRLMYLVLAEAGYR